MKKIIGVSLIILGIMVSLATFDPLYVMYKEGQIYKTLDKKYFIDQPEFNTNQFEINDNRIEIIDTPKGNIVNLQVLINGKALFKPMDVPVSNDGDYARGVWVNILNIHNKQETNHQNDLTAIVQSMPPDAKSWNIYYINGQKKMETKHITNEDRLSKTNENISNDYLEIQLLKRSGVSMIGYASDINYASINPFATLIPRAIFVFGIVLIVIGILFFVSGRKSKKIN
ncbi:hypothetical protein [Paenibacillus eucommiae]|uniref:DUF3068 domain-containing protein n=1 Tax=Paenibacillus eucommiae TaxID=1355755 RepID=A0ABS4J6R4_9BACL|nr:hypothetical protein [Paenibacillus eucommiae]MBP1995517.1 hypothetical protein [Paenibacillus eucommiae]